MSALATGWRAMDTLFDPDELVGRTGTVAAGRAAAVPSSEDADLVGSETVEMSGTRLGANGGGPRLDDLVAGLWEGLAAHRVVECPICGSEMRPEYGAHVRPLGGRCGGCGSKLA